MSLKERIEARLAQVIDPELGLNIVEMGLIYGVDVRRKRKGEMQKVDIRMTFTTPACPLANVILDDIKQKLEEFKDLDIRVDVVFDPLWSPELMSKKAKMKLGFL